MRISRRHLLAGVAAGVVSGTFRVAWARGTIRLVVGFPPGGSGDVFARITANGLAEQLDQTVIVDNRAGAGGLTAAEYVIRAPDDGIRADPAHRIIGDHLAHLQEAPAV